MVKNQRRKMEGISDVGNTNLWCCMSMKGQEANYKCRGDGNSSWSQSIKGCRESPLLQIPQRPNKQSQAIDHHRQHHRHLLNQYCQGVTKERLLYWWETLFRLDKKMCYKWNFDSAVGKKNRRGRRDGVMEITVLFHGYFTKRLKKAAASALLLIFTCATMLLFGSIWLVESMKLHTVYLLTRYVIFNSKKMKRTNKKKKKLY